MRKCTDRAAVIRCLEKLACYRPNDAIRLAMAEEGVDVGRLKLEGVSEFRRHANGAVEIRFFDRLKALELLAALSEDRDEDCGGLQAFLAQVAGGGDE